MFQIVLINHFFPHQESLCFELTFKERVIGFAATYLFGLLCSVLSWFSFGDWKAFGILSTAGMFKNPSTCGHGRERGG